MSPFSSGAWIALAVTLGPFGCGRVELTPLRQLDMPETSPDPTPGEVPILALTLGCATIPAPSGATESGWTDVETDARYRAGLVAWRASGAGGRACSHCHSVDGIDLAVLGYADETIRSGGAAWQSGPSLDAVVGFVHAQRRRFALARTCDPSTRPFQPGGAVLPGATARDQDASFSRELAARLPMLFGGRVETGADARAALRELLAIDLRTLPLGIALPRWSSPGTLESLLPPLGVVPNDSAGYHAMEDAYLASPTDEALVRLIRAATEETTDGGYRATLESNAKSANVNFTGTDWLTQLNASKVRGVMVAQHFMRHAALRDAEALLSRPAAPFPSIRAPLNPWFYLGGENVFPPAMSSEQLAVMLGAWPAALRARLPPADVAAGNIDEISRRHCHSFMTLGQVVDPTLLQSEPQAFNKPLYWSALHFEQWIFHEPFFHAHRLAQQVHYYEDLAGSPLHPGMLGDFAGNERVHPVLDGTLLYQRRVTDAVAVDDLAPADANRFRGNILRMWLLLQRERLWTGAPVRSFPNADQARGLADFFGAVSAFATRLTEELGQPASSLAALAPDARLYTSDLQALVGEVRGLAQAAKDVGP